MTWDQLYYNKEVQVLITASIEDGGILDDGHLADLRYAIQRLEAGGPQAIPAKLSKPMGDGLFEFRLNGKDSIARTFYCFASGRRIWYLHAIVKKSAKTPKSDLDLAKDRMKEIRDYERKQEQDAPKR